MFYFEDKDYEICSSCGERFTIDELMSGICNYCALEDEYNERTGYKDDEYEEASKTLYG